MRRISPAEPCESGDKSPHSKTGVNNLRQDLRPEIELLLACARTQMDNESARRAKELAQLELDWDYLLKTSLTHGLMPLLYLNLKSTSADVVPAEHLNRLMNLFRQNSARNVLLTKDLHTILDLFESVGIEAMPYKGPAIAVSIYGDLALRQFTDLDILVRRRDVWQCQQLLIARGYKPHFAIAKRQLPAFLKLSYVQMFTRDDTRSVVELHWAIASRFFLFPLDTDRLWDRLQHVDLMGRKVLAPAAEDLLLILCAHGAKDLWERLEWICGIAELIRAHPGMNWEAVMQQARELGAKRILLLGLFLAKEFFGANLPASLAARIEAMPAVKSLAAQVRQNLFREDHYSPPLHERVFFHIRSKERIADRLRYCTRLLLTTTPVDWGIVPLPACLSFLYPFLRPFRLAKKYGLDHSKNLLRP